jgi:hypothetical protein
LHSGKVGVLDGFREVLSKVAGAAKRAAELGFGEYIRQVRC